MSNHKFSSDLIDFGTKMKKGYAELAECIGKVIALITGIVAVLVTFTDVTFLGLATKEITATVIIMLICSYVIYISL
jgi:predicted RND superfamily exporter protein